MFLGCYIKVIKYLLFINVFNINDIIGDWVLKFFDMKNNYFNVKSFKWKFEKYFINVVNFV